MQNIIMSVPYTAKKDFENNPTYSMMHIEYRLDMSDDPDQIDFLRFTSNNILCYKGSNVPETLMEKMINSDSIIDIDLADIDEYLDRLPGNRLLISKHLDKYDEVEIRELINCPHPANAYKLALKARSFTEIVKVSELIEQSGRDNIIFSVTGVWGKFQRILHKFFNSSSVYIYRFEPTADGQISLMDFYLSRALYIDSGRMIAGIIGASHVYESYSFYAYNEEFKQEELDISFLPIPTTDPLEAIEVIRWLKQHFRVIGFAITNPLKQALAKALGSHIPIINTIVISDTRIPSFFYNPILNAFVQFRNTDTQALKHITTERAIEPSYSVLIHGTGDCAEAFVATLKKLGFKDIFIVGRNTTRQSHLIEKYSLSDTIPKHVNILINATPLGFDDSDKFTVLPAYDLLIDLPYVYENKSSLVQEAEARNIPFVDGNEFWEIQHEMQYESLTSYIDFDEYEEDK